MSKKAETEPLRELKEMLIRSAFVLYLHGVLAESQYQKTKARVLKLKPVKEPTP